jgi:hypothetical protein
MPRQARGSKNDDGFISERHALIAEYDDLNVLFLATTRPYKSTVSFQFDVVDGLGGPPALMAHAVLRANQNVEWFNYGIGDQIPIGVAGGTPLFKRATASDTNQSRGRRTNGVEDFIIEGVSCTISGVRIAYDSDDIPAGVVDGVVHQAYDGQVTLVDPGSLVSPPQVGSPFNLEHVFGEAIAPKCSIQFAWDRRNIIPIGTLDQIPEGGAKSYLKAHGVPETMNRYKIPEGYVWRRADKPDGDFAIQGQVTDAVVIPINNIALAASVDPDDLVQATQIFVDVALRVHGLGLNQPGANV